MELPFPERSLSSAHPPMIFPAADFEEAWHQPWSFAGEQMLVVGRFFLCWGLAVDFATCPVKLRLLQTLCKNQGCASAEHLLTQIYGISDITACSPGIQRAWRNRLRQLIAATREHLLNAFAAEWAASYRWLHFDDKRRLWVLCHRCSSAGFLC